MAAPRFSLSCMHVMRRYYAILAGLAAIMVLSWIAWIAMIGELDLSPAVVATTGALVIWFFSMLVLPVLVTVGDDGLYVRYGLATHYIPIEKVEGITPPDHEGRVIVILSQGEVRFHGTVPDAANMSRALERVIARRKRRDAPESVFARDGRSFAEWARAARALVDETASSYRAAKAPRDLALAHATNEKLPHDVRIGAVLAIAPDATKDEKAALVRIVDGIASPSLKRVLAHAAEGELDKAEEAHEQYEAERLSTERS